MGLELKTNTAVRIAVGPLVDPTDGKTAETGLTVTALSVQIYQIKTDSSAVVRTQFSPTTSGGTNDMVLVASSTDGMYDLELTATQLNFLGNARISLYDVDGFLVHYTDLQIVSANYFDNKFGSTVENVNVAQISGDSTAANNCELAFDGTGFGFTNCTIPTVTTLTGHTAQTADHTAGIADIPTVAEFNARTLVAADYVVEADTIAGVTLVTTCTTNTDMTGTDNAALASVCTEGRLAELDAANLPTDVAGVKTDTGNIVTDTNELQTDWVNGGRLDLILDELTAQGDTNEGKLDTIDTVVDAVLVDTNTTIPGLIAALNDLAAADVWDLASALTTDFGTLIERLYQGIFNKENITDATGAVALRTVGDSADLATWGITDNDTLTVRTEASWT